MKKRGIFVTTFVLISILLSFVGNSLFAGDVRGVTKNTIKVGVICDLTGPASNIFNGYLQSIQTCFRNINEHGRDKWERTETDRKR